ncbi:hypothetical protein Pflav_012040 [Phytohabitans flavus]|uniref:Uncharacterized protein n=1 Tax=Phytohabitans flavus TaxID=1076124 RepID=A0A6F8XLU1_9ACTN|nr:hypothetical protein Pflav_012040 [Phytohabitans flavus]
MTIIAARRRLGGIAVTVVAVVAAAVVLPGAAPASPTGNAAADEVTSQVIAAEQRATPGQREFSDFLTGLLEKAPQHVVDFSWAGDHGVVLASPQGRPRSAVTPRAVPTP